MSSESHFVQAISLLTNLNTISQSIHPSTANLDYMQRELFNTISSMVNINRQNAINLHRQQARQQQARPATPRRPRRTAYCLPAIPREKSKVVAKKMLEEACPTECAICQETPKYKNAICTDCNHYYCKVCWDSWINTPNSNKNCPTCRKDMPKITSYKARASSRVNVIPLHDDASDLFVVV